MDVEFVIEQLTEEIREYVSKAGAKGVVIGLSGGIDSAVVYGLCRLALEPISYIVCAAYISDKFSTDNNLSLIFKLTGDLKTTTHHITDIERTYKAMVGDMPLSAVVGGNLRSRLRMCYLYMLANNYDCLVAGTTNKTEGALGYYTKYGDGGVDFEVIGDLYKHEVYEIGKYLELPEEVLTKAPSAGLWKGQTDEQELGYSYDVLDDILKFLYETGYSQEEKSKAIIDLNKKGIKPKDVKRIQDMIARNHHKGGPPGTFCVNKKRYNIGHV